jgi:HD-GYP domain-containing protein (c-di-GMP phosphodiesterase class II)
MNLITTATLPDHVQETVTLQGRCLNARHRRSQHDRAFYELHFADSHGSAVVQIWSGNMLYDKFREIDWEELPPIELVGRVIQLDHCLRVKAEEISVVSDSHICNGAQLIPSAWVPLAAREAHAWLVQFIDTMQSPSLRTFMTGLLLDSAIGIPFIRSRASVKNHHNYPGGLLVHSVQMARMIEAMAKILGRNKDEILIAQVGALLHDLGKVRTVGRQNPRPISPRLFRHESQTLLLVGTYSQ